MATWTGVFSTLADATTVEIANALVQPSVLTLKSAIFVVFQCG